MTSEVPDLPGLTDLSPLGRGGLADVYLARQRHLERWVAAKVFRVALADEQAAERFRAECRAIGRLDQYPHVLTVYDAGVLGDGRPYLISERCDGSLHDLVAMRGPLPADRVAALGSTIGRALRFAHSAGVLHGDVTPQNLLLRTSGAPVLADFGLAVLRDHAPTAAGFTLLHAAPEALRSGTVIDERADVYGLGSTLYTVLTGTPPFPQHPGEDGAAYRARSREEPAARPDGVTDQMAGLLTAMLATDPGCRPSTDEVITALESAPGRGTRPAPPGGTLAATRPEADPPDGEVVAPSARTARTNVPRPKRGGGSPRPWDTRITRSTAATRSGANRPVAVPAAGAPLAGDTSVRSAADVPVAEPGPADAGRGASTESAPLPRTAEPGERGASVGSPEPAAGEHDVSTGSAPSPGHADPTGPAPPAVATGEAGAPVPDPSARPGGPATTYVPLAPIRPGVPDGLLWPSEPVVDVAAAARPRYPTSTLLLAPSASWSAGADHDPSAVAEPVRIPGRRGRRRRHGTVLLAAGGAAAVLAAGTGAAAAWRATDDGLPDRTPPRSPSVPLPAMPQAPAAPARTMPADLPPAAFLPGSTLGVLPPSSTAAPAPAARPAPPQRSTTRTPTRPSPADAGQGPASAGLTAPAPGPEAPRRSAAPPANPGPGGGARNRPPSPNPAADPAANPAARPPATPAPAARNPEPPTAQGRRDPTQAPRPEIRYR